MSEQHQGLIHESQVVDAVERSIGSFLVRRVLPTVRQRSVGPFLFLDHMGPIEFGPGESDVPPHPHIGLSTVTYLFEGEIMHRDSLGTEQLITPGAINWMTAGKGIVHSERATDEARIQGGRLHGLQIWIGLPLIEEEIAPDFVHYPAADIPVANLLGVSLRVLIGSAYGLTSPVRTFTTTLYVEAIFRGTITLDLPIAQERAVYVVSGEIRCQGLVARTGQLFVADESVCALEADAGTHLVIIGGDPLDGGRRHMYWNFVSSSKDRIEQAKQDWWNQMFPKVPCDELEFVQLAPDNS